MIKMSAHSFDTILVSEINGVSTKFKFPLKKMYRDYDIRCIETLKPKGSGKASLCRSLTGLGRGEKEPFKAFLKEYGITFNNLLKHVRGYAYAELVQPYEHLINSVCRGSNKGSYNWKMIKILHQRKEALRVLKEDGLTHLTPLVLILTEDTKQPCKYLKKLVGKSQWKEFCSNSFTRNCLIAKLNWDLAGRYEKLLVGPSSLLKYGNKILVAKYQNTLNYSDVSWFKVSDYKNYRTFSRWYNLVDDAVSTQKKLDKLKGKDTNHKTLKKKLFNLDKEALETLHNSLVEEYEEIRDQAAKEPIKWITDIFELSGSVMNTSYRILQSSYEIRKEGRIMHHCVGMYDSRVVDKEYLVVSIGNPDDEPSTLGLTVYEQDGKIVLKHQQHYYACNKTVDVERESVAYELIKKLNKEINNELPRS